ncbi:MAG TPA: GNAT family N-acetyltransferase [Bryobacteraceae bacterium]|nr:GNAT family N-acetyltransferase [Bryobacteraceae bacterium]
MNAIVKTKVRVAVGSDKARFRELMAVFTDSPMTPKQADNRLRLIARDPDQTLLVATVLIAPKKEYVVGMLSFRIRHNLESVSHYGEIATIVVDPKWRQQGVGAALLANAEELAGKVSLEPTCALSKQSRGNVRIQMRRDRDRSNVSRSEFRRRPRPSSPRSRMFFPPHP